MRNLGVALVLGLIILVVVVPLCDDPLGQVCHQQNNLPPDSNDLTGTFRQLVTDLRDALYLVGWLLVRALPTLWQATPARLKPVFGIAALVDTALLAVAFTALVAFGRLMRRLLK